MAGTRAGLVAMVAVTSIACTGSLAPPICADGGACGSSQKAITKTFTWSINRQLDVLFVVDDTAAVAPWADSLRAGYPAMARALENVPYGVPNIHVGFVRASRCAPPPPARDCGVATPDAFLRLETCGRIANFSGSFVDTFACLADFGTPACASAQPLEAVRDVLAQPPPAGWQGFLRPEAALQVVFIAGQDLASDAAVAELTMLLKAQKPDPTTIMVSVMVPGDCSPSQAPTPRWIELAQNFGSGGLSLRLCDEPTGLFSQISRGPIWVLQPPCFADVVDLDPSAPGVQAECTFQDTTVAPDGTRVTTALPACDVAAPPCWRLEESTIATCTAAILIDRAADWCQETLTTTRVECLAATN